MKKSIFITVRMGSTRLPGKALKKLGGTTTIEYLIRRLKFSSLADNIIVCTTNHKRDDVLVQLAKKNQINYFRGSEKDKLARWLGAAEYFNTDFFVTADGDDSFCEPMLIDLAFKQFDSNHSDYIESENIICGAFTNGISFKALRKVCLIKDTTDTEMIWPYFKKTKLFKIENLNNVPSRFFRNDIRLTLDYIEDLNFMREIVRLADKYKLKNDNYLTLDSIIKIVEKKPEILEINNFRHLEWANNQKNNTKLVLKK